MPDDNAPAAAVGRNVAALHDYITELALQDLAPLTFLKYQQCLRTFSDWLGSRPISTETAKYFIAYLRQSGYKPRSIELYYHAIKPFLEYLGIPFRMKFRKPKDLPSYHSPDQVAAVLQATLQQDDYHRALRDYTVVLTFVFTGLRRSELLALRPADIQNGYIAVRHAKGDKDRVVPVADELQEALDTYIAELRIPPFARLFPFEVNCVYRIVTRSAKRASIPNVSPHSLRHAFATTLVERGIDIKSISQLLGHADISTTAIYLDIVPTHLKNAVAALDGAFTPPASEAKSSVSESSSEAPAHAQAGSTSSRESLRICLSRDTTSSAPARGSSRTTTTSSDREDLCGSDSTRATPSTARSTSAPSNPSPSTGRGSALSPASTSVAPTVHRAAPSAGATRPKSSSRARSLIGSSEKKSWHSSRQSPTSTTTPTSSSPRFGQGRDTRYTVRNDFTRPDHTTDIIARNLKYQQQGGPQCPDSPTLTRGTTSDTSPTIADASPAPAQTSQESQSASG